MHPTRELLGNDTDSTNLLLYRNNIGQPYIMLSPIGYYNKVKTQQIFQLI